MDMNFVFEEDSWAKYLICPICAKLFQNPMRLNRCGHTFCELCISNKVCFICSKPFQNFQPDLTAAGLIADMIVRCKTQDCPFRGTYEEYSIHHQNNCRLQQCGGLENWKKQLQESLSQFVIEKVEKSKKDNSNFNEVKPESLLQKQQTQCKSSKNKNNSLADFFSIQLKRNMQKKDEKQKFTNNRAVTIYEPITKNVAGQIFSKFSSKKDKQEVQIIQL